MKFHAEFNPAPFPLKIKHTEKLLLIGSCFTEQIGARLSRTKFSVLENPHGILFNPVSITDAISSYCNSYLYKERDLFYFNELWASWKHHSRFSGMDKEQALTKINNSQQAAIAFIKQSDWILITLGSAFVYEQNENESLHAVANCHKVPADKFNHRLLQVDEIKSSLKVIHQAVWSVNPKTKFIYTISPVRHLREGFIENNRSKAALIQAVHSITSENIFYFPAYELIIDDLRDYRFYAEDMVHPNYAATNYVWEKFLTTCIDKNAIEVMNEMDSLYHSIHHKPFNAASEQHKKFRALQLQKLLTLKERYGYLDLAKEIEFFNSAV